MRKEADFEVMDRSRYSIREPKKVGHIFAENCDTIKKEVLATESQQATRANTIKNGTSMARKLLWEFQNNNEIAEKKGA